MIEKLLQDLQFDEGWRDKPYRDSRGFLTIGFGFLIDERKPVELPKPVGLYWLEFVAEQRWSELIAVLPWIEDCDENVQRALANMAYQLGIGGVLKFRKMLDALKRGDRATAALEALDSDWAKQTPRRAKRVANLIAGA
jgi:lysozyme